MKALVFHKPKDVNVDTVDDPKIEAKADAIIRITSLLFVAPIYTSITDLYLSPVIWF